MIMKLKSIIIAAFFIIFFGGLTKAQSKKFTNPIVDENLIFEEKMGAVAVEAEFFYKQSKTEVREWFRSSKFENPQAGRDADTLHVSGASNNAYLEILPDTRIVHADPLVDGENFTNIPGVMAIVHYKVKFNNPGRYYVWARALSTGGEDNGLHVGVNDKWTESGQRMQWCDGRGSWTWASKQRTNEEHCGIPYAIFIDIPNVGVHDIQFSMREDGFEFDKFILTKDKYFKPVGTGIEVVANGPLPKPYPVVASPIKQKSYFETISVSLPGNKWISAQQFPSLGTDFYTHGDRWLAINPKTHKEAITSTAFNFESGKYDVVFVGVGENDGSSTFQILLNDKEIGTYQPKPTPKMFEEGKEYNALWKNIEIKKGDKITVYAKVGTDGKEFTRGRWAGIVFTPVGKGKSIQNAPSSYLPN